jgi:hypothetical protein
VNLHSIDIQGGYSGTVQVTVGKLQLDRGGGIGGGYSFRSEIKFYHFCLLTPDRRNIEFYLLRFADGEWCETKNMYPFTQWSMDEKLVLHAKAQIFKMGL